MLLEELRKALQLTQQQVAVTLDLNQAAVSKMESQTDRYVSTLRRFVEAMGGELRIVAHFPQGDVVINQLACGNYRAAGTAGADHRCRRKSAYAVGCYSGKDQRLVSGHARQWTMPLQRGTNRGTWRQ